MMVMMILMTMLSPQLSFQGVLFSRESEGGANWKSAMKSLAAKLPYVNLL